MQYFCRQRLSDCSSRSPPTTLLAAMSTPVADYASDLVTRLWKRAEGSIVTQGILLALPPAMLLYGVHSTVRRNRAEAEVRERLRVMERDAASVVAAHKEVTRTLEELDHTLANMRTALRTQATSWASLQPDASAEDIANSYSKVEDLHCALMFDLGLALGNTKKIRQTVNRRPSHDAAPETDLVRWLIEIFSSKAVGCAKR